jgi:hypothetical protein
MFGISPARYLLILVVAVGCANAGRQRVAEPRPVELDEPALMAKIRTDAKTAPTSALSFAEEGEQRFGDSGFAEERRALVIQSLINLQRIGLARSRAYEFLQRYPSGSYSAHVAAMTGVHPRPGRQPSQP